MAVETSTMSRHGIILCRIDHSVQNITGRQRSDMTESLPVLQTVAHGSITSHRQAGDISVFPLTGQGKHVPRHFNQLFADKFAVHFPGVLTVHIEMIVTGRHDHNKIAVLRPSGNPRAIHPIRIVPENPMQQIQSLKGLLFPHGHPRKRYLIHRHHCIYGYRAH